jgi:hypothetical protein
MCSCSNAARGFSFSSVSLFCSDTLCETTSAEKDLKVSASLPDERQSRIAQLVAINGKVYVTVVAFMLRGYRAERSRSLEQKGLLSDAAEQSASSAR